jgi:hypothetical protein
VLAEFFRSVTQWLFINSRSLATVFGFLLGIVNKNQLVFESLPIQARSIPLVKNLPVDRVALGVGILIQRSIRHPRSSILMTQKPASLAAGSRNL